jgi:putative ABC transport system permease protein
MREMRYAMRQLRKAPGFSATVVLTLALGIGASAAIFCLMDGLWLHPLAVPRSGELTRVFATTPQGAEGLFTFNDYQAIAQRATEFRGVVAIGRRGSLMPRTDGTSAMLLTNVVSSNFFEVLGVKPPLGRAFDGHDGERLRTHPAVVLGYGFWRREFNGDPNIVGRQITMLRGRDHRNTVEVLGVLPADFREIDPNSDRDLWMAAETWATLNGPGDLISSEFRWFSVVGRLAPGTTAATANDQVAAIAQSLQVAEPASHHDRGARALSDFKYRMDLAGTTGVILFAVVACVVVLATMNVAHLLLARAITRKGEVALRLSLGARRATVARQLLLENAVLGIAALGAGLLLAAAIAATLPRLLVLEPEMLNASAGIAAFHLDWRVFGFASALAFVTMLLLAVVPLMQAGRAQLIPALQTASAARTEGRTPTLRRAAIWVQIGLSFALLVSTMTLVRSFLNTRTQPIGLTRGQVLVAFTQDPDEPMRSEVLAKLRALPGVKAAAFGIRSPLMPSEGGIAAKVLLPSHPELRAPVEIKYNAVSPDFLAVTGTRVVLGREFNTEDNTSGPPVVLVSQAMARKYWPGANPIGQLVRLPRFNDGSDLDLRVVGVAEDAPINQVGEIAEPYMYIPFRFSSMGEVTFVIESEQNAMTLAPDARQVFIRANPLLDPMFMTSLPGLIRYSAGNYQMMAELVSALGMIALMLTVVGLSGFLAFRVSQRQREIGIRMALGATRRATGLLIMRDTARMAGIGLLLGVGACLASVRIEASALFGVKPLDALSIIAAFVIMMTAVVAAAWLPARRAASVEPMQALRTE